MSLCNKNRENGYLINLLARLIVGTSRQFNICSFNIIFDSELTKKNEKILIHYFWHLKCHKQTHNNSCAANNASHKSTKSKIIIGTYIYIYIYIYIGFLDRIKEHTVGIYRLLVLQSSIGIISRIPESVGEPYRISNHCISIIITVPNKVSMGSVLDIQHAMTETGFTKSRVTWLWFRHHTAPQEENMYNLINTV